MYEVVKAVKGYEITRAVGSRGFYSVIVRAGKWGTESRNFRSIKAAAEYIERFL